MDQTSREAGRFFEGYAGEFDELYDIQHRKGIAGWLNRRLRASMAIRYERTFLCLEPMKGKTVLDIGCGSGRYIVTSLRLGASRVVGIDLSGEMLGIARSVVDRLGGGVGTAELIQGDFLSRPFAEPFDYAIVMGVMDYIANPAGFLRKLRVTVRDKAVLSFPVAESIWAWQRRIRYRLRKCPLFFYRRGELEELLKSCGCSSYVIERIERDYFVMLKP